MKKKEWIFSFTLLTIVSLLTSCSGSADLERLQPSDQIVDRDFSMDSIKTFFAKEYSICLKERQQEDVSAQIWDSGHIIPLWNRAKADVNDDSGTWTVKVPVITEYDYHTADLRDESPSNIKNEKLLIIKKKSSGIRTIKLHYSFDNLVVETSLGGIIRNVEKYESNKLIDFAYKGTSNSDIARQRFAYRLDKLLDGIVIIRNHTDLIITRNGNPGDTSTWYLYLDSCVHVEDKKPLPPQWWKNPEFDFYNDTTWIGYWDDWEQNENEEENEEENNNGLGVGAGGGCGGGGSSYGQYQGSYTHTSQTNNQNNNSSQNNDRPKPADLSHMIGDKDYYKERNADLLNRDNTYPKDNYYIIYGDKYCNRFSELIGTGKLSIEGDVWIDKTLASLQTKLELLLQSNPAIESDPETLRRAAYGTHPVAYIESGFLELTLADKIQIFLTIDPEDLTDDLGREQVWIIMQEQIKYYGKHEAACIRDATYILTHFSEIQVAFLSYLEHHRSTRCLDQLHEQYFTDLLLGDLIAYFDENVDFFSSSDLIFDITLLPDEPY